MEPVYLDLSQLVAEPLRSGIQRAERELIRHWPGPAPLLPCRFDPAGSMRTLPPRIFEPLCADATADGLAGECARLAPFLTAPGAPVPPGARLLCAELFHDAARAAFYAGPAGARASWLVYDFLPWLRPGWFPARVAVGLMPYLHALRRVADRAFISAQVRAECAGRILCRPEPGPVIPMGADGLGLPRRPFDAARTDFVMLGSIEPRKNPAAVIHAFRRLWAEGCPARLVMVGALNMDAFAEAALLGTLMDERRFLHLPRLPDAGVRAALAGARAVLFPSEGEGYGIPPMEALASGIPVVVWSGLPALAGLPGLGQIRLDQITPAALAGAVRVLLDDAEAGRLWAEAARLSLPGWRDFAETVAGWVLRSGRA